ncbi:MAG: SufE family protein [Planctomycetota bacterium]|nr:SufE family protein [Planctomycetota bacterium]
MNIIEKQVAIVREFAVFESWEERYKHLIKIGRELPALPAEDQTDDAKVRGCSSSVWLHANCNDDGSVHLRADSDAMIVRGLVALLVRVYTDEQPDAILSTEPMFIEELELEQHLTQNRANGLASMVKQIKTYALAFKAQSA